MKTDPSFGPCGRVVRTLAALVLSGLAGWSSPLAAREPDALAGQAAGPVTTLPIELVGTKIFLPVEINGSASYDFILDTGSPVMLLTAPELARQMSLATDRRIRLNGAGRGESPQAFVAEAATLGLPGAAGGVELPDQRVVILAENPGFGTFLGVESYGIVGRGLFERFVVAIDFDRDRIALYEPETYVYDGPGVVVPIRIEGGHPHCTATIELPGGAEHRLDVVIDSGAGSALTVIEDRRRGLAAPPSARTRYLGRGLNGEIQGTYLRAPRLRLGGVVLTDVVTAFADRRTGIAPGAQANVGADILRRFRVIFDYRRGRMILEPGAAFEEPFEIDMSGLRFRAVGKGLEQLVVEAVREGSPADAVGLEEGDRVLSLAGRQMSLAEASKLLRRRAGDEIPIEVERRGRRLEVRLILSRDV